MSEGNVIIIESPQPRRLIKRARSAELLGVSITTIREYEKAGRLTPIRLGKRNVYHEAEQVDALIKELVSQRSGQPCTSPVPPTRADDA